MVQKANTLEAINSPGIFADIIARARYITPKKMKRLTNHMPLAIQDVFQPEENKIRQNLRGRPKSARCKPPPNMAHMAIPINIVRKLPKIEDTKNVAAPTSTKKCSRCGVQMTAAPEKIYNHVKFCRNKAKKTALKNSQMGRYKSKGGNKNKGNRQKWNV